jgi:hypothetical protein
VTEVGLWHARQGQAPVRLMQHALPSEKDLEAWIESDPSLIAPGLHAVRSQVPLGTKFMDYGGGGLVQRLDIDGNRRRRR